MVYFRLSLFSSCIISLLSSPFAQAAGGQGQVPIPAELEKTIRQRAVTAADENRSSKGVWATNLDNIQRRIFQMPGRNNNCFLYSFGFPANEDSKVTRKRAVDIWLKYKKDPAIRKMVAPEIMDLFKNGEADPLPEQMQQTNAYRTLRARYDAAMAALVNYDRPFQPHKQAQEAKKIGILRIIKQYFQQQQIPVQIAANKVHKAGHTTPSDTDYLDAAKAHINELASLGVRTPAQTPFFDRVTQFLAASAAYGTQEAQHNVGRTPLNTALEDVEKEIGTFACLEKTYEDYVRFGLGGSQQLPYRHHFYEGDQGNQQTPEQDKKYSFVDILAFDANKNLIIWNPREDSKAGKKRTYLALTHHYQKPGATETAEVYHPGYGGSHYQRVVRLDDKEGLRKAKADEDALITQIATALSNSGLAEARKKLQAHSSKHPSPPARPAPKRPAPPVRKAPPKPTPKTEVPPEAQKKPDPAATVPTQAAPTQDTSPQQPVITAAYLKQLHEERLARQKAQKEPASSSVPSHAKTLPTPRHARSKSGIAGVKPTPQPQLAQTVPNRPSVSEKPDVKATPHVTSKQTQPAVNNGSKAPPQPQQTAQPQQTGLLSQTMPAQTKKAEKAPDLQPASQTIPNAPEKNESVSSPAKQMGRTAAKRVPVKEKQPKKVRPVNKATRKSAVQESRKKEIKKPEARRKVVSAKPAVQKNQRARPTAVKRNVQQSRARPARQTPRAKRPVTRVVKPQAKQIQRSAPLPQKSRAVIKGRRR